MLAIKSNFEIDDNETKKKKKEENIIKKEFASIGKLVVITPSGETKIDDKIKKYICIYEAKENSINRVNMIMYKKNIGIAYSKPMAVLNNIDIHNMRLCEFNPLFEISFTEERKMIYKIKQKLYIENKMIDMKRELTRKKSIILYETLVHTQFKVYTEEEFIECLMYIDKVYEKCYGLVDNKLKEFKKLNPNLRKELKELEEKING